jgi:transposase
LCHPSLVAPGSEDPGGACRARSGTPCSAACRRGARSVQGADGHTRRWTREAGQHEAEIASLTRQLAPHLLNQPGIGTLAAAQLLLSWSHPGRVRNEAAFARLAGCTPIPASSGQTIRYRLDRSGDRQLNRALHMILITRRRWHQPTIDYLARRRADGKTSPEANHCLKRYLARNLYRLLEHGAPTPA